MKNLIRKWLGLPSEEQVQKFNEMSFFTQEELEKARKLVELSRIDMERLRNNMKKLYSKLESDIRNVKSNVKQIKPVLKIQDKESEKFIRDILSRHDRNMQNNHNTLAEKVIGLNTLEQKAQSAIQKAEQSNLITRNFIMSLGLDSENMQAYSNLEIFQSLRETVLEKLKEKEAS